MASADELTTSGTRRALCEVWIISLEANKTWPQIVVDVVEPLQGVLRRNKILLH